jgi:hypothetical protein
MGEESMIMRVMTVASLLLVSACSTAANYDMAPDRAPVGDDSCGAGARQYLVGQSIDSVDTTTLAEHVRAVYPGDMVTMDHRPDRLNLGLDDDGIIVALSCG